MNTAFLKDIAANIERASGDAPLRAYMAYGPPGSEDFFRRELPDGVGLVEAWFGNFGTCLLETARALLGRGHLSVCLLNADSPTLPTAFLVEAARALAAPGDRAVLGPAEDGGYYLLGLKAAHRRLFEDVDWSTERVFDQTLARAGEIGLPVVLLPPWYDVDDEAALARLRREVSGPSDGTRAGGTGPAPSEARHTRALLQSMARAGAPA